MRRPRPPKSARGAHALRAFTLVEVLLVVAMVGLLAAVLLPVLAAARERGRMVQCASHMRQIGSSLLAYALDQGDTFPVNLELWNVSFPTLRGRQMGPGVARAWAVTLQAWMRMDRPPWLRPFACPQARYTPWTDPPHGDDPGSAWVLNTYCSGRRSAGIPRPADGVLLFESGVWSMMSEDTGYLEQANHPRFYPHPRVAGPYTPVAWDWTYGGTRRNIFWCDGHVGSFAARRWPRGDQLEDSDRIRHMRFGLPRTHPWDP